MKKASATVIYDSVNHMIYNLTINHKMNLINMIHYDLNKNPKPYKYRNFKDLYQTVLDFARNNGFYYGSYKQFGTIFYDVSWIDINNPTIINKYGFNKGE